ncbi:MAG: SIS domain-containing protein [Clostridiales bacterium]|nr:SIS domain-containing protein [Clostridiales bacterium]
MIKFNEAELRENYQGTLALRPGIEAAVDKFYEEGFDSIWIFGTGGTWATGVQAEYYMRGKCSIPVYVEQAGEFNVTGNKRLTDNALVLFTTVTGTTGELITAMETIRKTKAKVIGFVDEPGTPLTKLCDVCFSWPHNSQIKFWMVLDRIQYLHGDFPDYDKFYAQLDAHLAQGLCDIEKQADEFAHEWAKKKVEWMKENKDMPHYFIGAGPAWGNTYSTAMCYWEEMLWIRTKSISAPEFFHGTLEIIEKDTPVTLYLTEDEQRPLEERVARFLPRVCERYTIIDTKDYKLEGIDEEYRGRISHLITRCVNNRIEAHLEVETRHPMEIRRYYRQFPY